MSDEQSRPGLDTLADYLEGLLSEEESREVERWVAEDAATAERLRELEELPGLLAADPVQPMPGDVVHRVDAALAAAALVQGGRDQKFPAGSVHPSAAPRGADARAGVVVPLRRRRWLAPAMAAAAMLGVVAIGAQVVSSGGLDDFPTSASDSDDAGAESADEAGGVGEPEGASQGAEAPTYRASMLPRIRTETFATDVADALAGRPPAQWDSTARDGVDDLARVRGSLLSADCPVELAAGRVLPIRLDGEPAVLVLRRVPAEPDRREALAYPADCPLNEEEAEADLVPLVSAVITLP